MITKIYTYGAIILSLGSASALQAQESTFKIEGTTSAKNNGLTIYILHPYEDTMRSDSMRIENGKFAYTGKVVGPTLINLLLKHKGKPFNPFSDDADKFTAYVKDEVLTLTFTDHIQGATYSGSALTKAFNAYSSLFPSFEKTKKSQTEYLEERRRIQQDYITKNPNSYFSLVALTEFAAGNLDMKVVDPLYASLSDEVRSTPLGQLYKKLLDRARPTALGAIAPDFQQQDENGKMIKLSDFRGKYVLIDFWASWCKPCRAENPTLVKAYARYKDKNFTILGVSLDDQRSRQAWINAIAQDQLTWTQVSDLKGWKNEVALRYNISSVPRNFLLDPQGKIIAVDLRGAALEAKLNQLL